MKIRFLWRLIAILTLSYLMLGWIQPSVPVLDSLKYLGGNDEKFAYLDRQITRLVYADPSSALACARVYDSLARSQPDSQYFVLGKIKMGMGCYATEQYDASIQYYVDALQKRIHLPSKKDLAQLLNNLATTYQVIGDIDKSIDYYKEAFDIYQDERDSLWMANINSNLGLLLLNGQRLEEAEPRIEQALDFFRRTGNSVFEGFALLNLANLRLAQEDFKSCIPLYEQAMELVPTSVNPLLTAAANSGIGVAHRQLKDYRRSENYLLLGLTQARSINHNEQTIACHDELAKLYEIQGKDSKALDHYKRYFTLRDSTFAQEQDAIMMEVLTKYETEKKEKEIAILSSQKQVDEAKLLGSKRLLWVFSVGLILLSSLLYWLFLLNKRIQKGAMEKDTLLREIHHRVKNNLQVISALLTLQSKYIKDEHAKEALRSGQDRVRSMALIHKDLYQHENLKGVNTKDYIERLVENLLESYRVGEHPVEVEYAIQSLWLDVDTMIPLGLMINELVSNALKHGFKNQPKGRLVLSLREVNKGLKLRIEDNGKGRVDFDRLQKGFGFSLINSFAKKLNATIHLSDKDGFSIKMEIKNYTIAA